MDDIEAVAKAIKADIGKQWDAKPLPMPYDDESQDWSATGGTLNLCETAQAAIVAHKVWLKDNGWAIVRREPSVGAKTRD